MATEIPLVPAPEYPQVTLATRLAGEDLDADTQRVSIAGTPTRYTNSTAEQIVKSGPGYIHHIILESAPTSASSITVRNSTQILTVINIPPNAPWTRYELGFRCNTDIRVQASSVSLTYTVVWS